MKIGIVTGLRAEARIARQLGGTVAVGGGTEAGARAAAEALVAGGAGALLSFGLAGGLDPALRPGAILVPAGVLAGGRAWPADDRLVRALGGPTQGTICGEGDLVTDATQKRRLREATGAVAVDLESCAVARAAHRAGLPFAVLRAVCDPAERDLPQAARIALTEKGAIGLRRVALSVLRQPLQIAGLIALARDAAAARRALLARIRDIGQME